MELMEVLRNRRAVREFTHQPITRADIGYLAGAATLAPSAMNLQPWAFAAVLDPERINSYADRAAQWLTANATATGLTEQALGILRQAGFNMFHHAPALVLVMAQSATPQATEDCCLAAENLMLAARDRGIGSCWIGFARPWLNLPPTKNELGIPEEFHVVAPIILGYPQVWPDSHGRKSADIRWV